MNKHSFRVWFGLGPVAVRPAQLGHAVQRRTAHQHLRRLSREPVRRYPITKNRLEPKHCGLRQASAMIPTLALPRRPPHLPNAAQILIAGQALSLGIPMPPNLGIVLRWNRGPGVARPDRLIAAAPVIAPITRYLSNLIVHLLQ